MLWCRIWCVFESDISDSSLLSCVKPSGSKLHIFLFGALDMPSRVPPIVTALPRSEQGWALSAVFRIVRPKPGDACDGIFWWCLVTPRFWRNELLQTTTLKYDTDEFFLSRPINMKFGVRVQGDIRNKSFIVPMSDSFLMPSSTPTLNFTSLDLDWKYSEVKSFIDWTEPSDWSAPNCNYASLWVERLSIGFVSIRLEGLARVGLSSFIRIKWLAQRCLLSWILSIIW